MKHLIPFIIGCALTYALTHQSETVTRTPERKETMSELQDVKEKPDSYYKSLEIDTLARSIWGEARDEGAEGMEAVASVILNRVKVAEEKGRYWWGNNIIQVAQKPYQFSCWNRSDPNFKKLREVDETDADFLTALRIARLAVSGDLQDSTNGATHYHAVLISPYWAKGEKPIASVGNHRFYNLAG